MKPINLKTVVRTKNSVLAKRRYFVVAKRRYFVFRIKKINSLNVKFNQLFKHLLSEHLIAHGEERLRVSNHVLASVFFILMRNLGSNLLKTFFSGHSHNEEVNAGLIRSK